MFEEIKKMSSYRQRTFLARVLLYSSMLCAAIVLLFYDVIFYSQAKNNPADSWRFVWALLFMLLGLALRAYRYRQEPGPPFVAYWTYLCYFCVANFILFAMCHSFLGMGNWLYYPVSATGAVLFAQPDGVIQKMEGFINKFFGLAKQDRTE